MGVFLDAMAIATVAIGVAFMVAMIREDRRRRS